MRSDYILLSDTSGVVPGSVRVMHEMDLHAAAPDHIPVCARAKFANVKCVRVAKRRKVNYDRQAVADAKALKDPFTSPAVRQLAESVHNAPAVPSCVDPCSHEFVVMSHFEAALSSAFPRPPSPVKQKYLTQPTVFQYVLA